MNTSVLYALICMFFAGLTSILAKYGLKEVSGDVALIIRTVIIVIIVWVNVFLFDSVSALRNISRHSYTFLILSGITTSFSWIFYYKAIKIGNVSEVAIIDKGSIVITLLLAFFILKEPFTPRVAVGGSCVLAGIIIMAFK